MFGIRGLTNQVVTAELPSPIESAQFDTGYAGPGAHSPGLVYWDADNGTLSVMADITDVVLQVGQESYLRVYNDSGADIDDGDVVYISGAEAVTGHPTIELAQADTFATSLVAGVATSDILDGTEGLITTEGVVRGLNTLAWSAGDDIYLDPSVAGGMTNVEPSIPDFVVKIGVVGLDSATDGTVIITHTGALEVDTPVVFTNFIEQNTRNLDEAIHGIFEQIVNGSALNNGAPINVTNGLGKLFFVFNAGADFTGSITITGTSVNRNTGVETPGDTDVLTVSTLTTDNSSNDAEGNVRHAFVNGLISTKWFKGAVAITTADTNFTDVDVWNIAFEQVNDSDRLELTTLDATMLATNNSAWFYGYLYVVEVGSNQLCDISREVSLELPVGETAANLAYRLRKGNVGKTLDGSTDGFWLDVHFGPNAQTYWRNVTIKVWFDVGTNLR